MVNEWLIIGCLMISNGQIEVDDYEPLLRTCFLGFGSPKSTEYSYDVFLDFSWDLAPPIILDFFRIGVVDGLPVLVGKIIVIL